MKAARPKKLRNGSWGAVIESSTHIDVEAGEEIQIVTRSGKTWTATISEIIWSGKGYNGGQAAIVATASAPAKSEPSRSNVACPDGCGLMDLVRKNSDGSEDYRCNNCSCKGHKNTDGTWIYGC